MRNRVTDIPGNTPGKRGWIRLLAGLAALVAPVAGAVPTVTSYSPASHSRLVVGRQPLQIFFANPVAIGSGNISIRRSLDNSTLETISSGSRQVAIGGAALLHGFEYSAEEFNSTWGAASRSRSSAQVHSGSYSLAITTDSAWKQAEARYLPNPQDWSGIDSLVAWVHTSISGAQAEIITRSGPGDTYAPGMSPANLNQNAWTRIAMPISGILSPDRVNSLGFNFSSAGTYYVDDIALVKSGSNCLTFVPSATFTHNTSYFVVVDAGTVKDAGDGQSWPGIQNSTTWLLFADYDPSSVSLAGTSVGENLPAGTTVGTISATDPDGETSFLYTLPSGTSDNASFSIEGSTLKTATRLDFEAKSSYTVKIRAYDSRGGYAESQFGISVRDAPDRLTWDCDTSSGIQACPGGWGTDNFWTFDGKSLFAWPGASHTAAFEGSDGSWAIGVSGTQQADSLVFSNSGYRLSQGTISLSKGRIVVATGKTDTLDRTLVSATSLTLSGGGTLVALNSAAQQFGSLDISAGTFVVSRTSGEATGNKLGTGSVRIAQGAALVLDSLVQGDSMSNPMRISGDGTGDGAILFRNNHYGVKLRSKIVLDGDARIGTRRSSRAGGNDHVSLDESITGPYDITFSPFKGSFRATGTVAVGGDLVVDGTDTFALGNPANSYTGNTVVSSGTLKLLGSNAIPNGPGKGDLLLTGSLDLQGSSDTINGLQGSGTIDNTASSPSLLAAGSNDRSSTFAGSIRSTTGSVSLSKIGSGSLAISGANSHTGTTRVAAGTLLLGSSTALGTADSGTIVFSGATLDLGGQTVSVAEPLVLSGTGTSGKGALANSGTSAAGLAGPLTFTGDTRISADGGAIVLSDTGSIQGAGWILTLSGSAAGSRLAGRLPEGGGSLTKTGTGSWSLDGASAYTGSTQILEGTLRTGVARAFAATDALVVDGTLDLHGNDQTAGSLVGKGVVDNQASGTTSILAVGGKGASTTFSGTIRNSGSAGARQGLAKDGSGTLVLSGTNTYAGPTFVRQGRLTAGSANGLSPSSAFTVDGTLDLGGFSAEIASLAGSGSVDNSSGSGLATLTAGSDNTSTRFSGSVGNSSGSVSLAKTGTGTMRLGGTNTYSGPTRVRGGTLELTGVLSAASRVEIDSGAIFRGTGSAPGRVSATGGSVGTGSVDSIGILRVGKLDLSNGIRSTLRIRIAATSRPGTDHDRLVASDSLVLGGKSALLLDLSSASATGTVSGIALAGTIVGKFDTVVLDNPLNLAAEVVYASGSVDVVLSSLPPSFSKGGSMKVPEDAGAKTIAGWATSIFPGTGKVGRTVGFRVSSDRPELFSVRPSIAPDGALSFTPAPDSNGTVRLQVRLGASETSDSSTVDTFSIEILPVNDPPSFKKGPDQAVLKNSGRGSVDGWATGISAGPPDESGQKTAFRVWTRDSTLFSGRPAISASGELTFAPAEGATGSAIVVVRLGDDGGTENGGRDSGAVDSFRIDILPPLSISLSPDTLRLRPGDTARIRLSAKKADGTDTAIGAGRFVWTWTTPLGDLDTGFVAVRRAGSSIVAIHGLGTADSCLVLAKELDTTLPASTDSVKIGVGHGATLVVPPHSKELSAAVRFVDSALAGAGIAGADTAVVVSIGPASPAWLSIPVALVPKADRSQYGTPAVFVRDSTGTVHLVASTLLRDSTLRFQVAGERTYWLGFDTVPPTVVAKLDADSIFRSPIRCSWELRDNVAETGIFLCLLRAGSASPACSLIVASDSAQGDVELRREAMPLGARSWMEGRDSRDTVRSEGRDIVVWIDTLQASWTRAEDRYELVALPYQSGVSSAHAAFQRQWGDDDDRKWRAFGADSGLFVEILSGEPMDAHGRGFWVRTRKLERRLRIAQAWSPAVSTPERIRLQPGWNAVGNPFGFDVPWSQVRRLSGLDTTEVTGPYSFDGPTQGWTIPDTTATWGAWKGIAILNSGDAPVDLVVPSLPDGKTAGRAALVSPSFRMSASASQTEIPAPKVWVGIDGIRRAIPLPPFPAAGLRAYLTESGTPGTPLLSDVRTPCDSGCTWTLRVAGLAPRSPLSLALDRAGSDTGIPAWIHDDKSGRWLALRPEMEFAVSEEDSRTFGILVGRSPGAIAPRIFGLENRGRRVAWSLPDEMGRSRVRIDAFDIRGRRLLTLVDEDMDPGEYSKALDLSSPTGQIVLVLQAGGMRRTLQRFWRR